LLLHVLTLLTGQRGRSAFVALLFAIHPLHVESVAWISERKDVLSAFFGLLTLVAYAKYVRSPRPRRYVLVLAAYAAGLMAKPMLVTLPLLLVLIDFWPLRRWPVPRNSWVGVFRDVRIALWDKLPLLALAGLSSGMTLWAQARGGALTGIEALPVGQRVVNAVVSCAAYVAKTVWPFRLSAIYPHPRDGLGVGLIAACAVGLILTTVAVLRSRRRIPYATVGWLWYVIGLVPVIGLVQVGVQAMADRYTYLPSIGLFLVVAWGVPDLLEAAGVRRRRKTLLCVGAVAVALLLGVRARDQVRHWRDGVALFEHALSVTEPNPRAHNGLGMALSSRGRSAEALEQFRRAVAISPAYAEARANLAGALALSGRLEEAREQFDEALRLNPRDAGCRTNLGTMLMKQGRPDEAERQFVLALEIRADDATAHKNLGVVLAQRGDVEQAIRHFTEALRLEPDDVGTQRNLERARSLLQSR
jgi:Flp pilus assembly protein TadD